jgi:DNA-binding beta-propeller fold protein YncE
MRLRPDGQAAVSGSGPERLIEPAGVAADAFGRVYVSDAGLHRLVRYDARGTWMDEAGALGSDPGMLRRPGSVAALGSFGVAVLDRENRRIVSYDLNGRLAGTLVDLDDRAFADRVGRVDPVCLAADKGGAMVLADADRDRLLVFDFSGRFIRELGGFGPRPGSFRGLSGVAVTPKGELVAVERVNARVQRLEAGGRAIASWPLDIGAGRGGLAVAVDDSARIAVADEPTGRLWVFDRNGRVLATANGLAGPRALAFSHAGALLVAEARAGRVSRYALVPAGAGARSK